MAATGNWRRTWVLEFWKHQGEEWYVENSVLPSATEQEALSELERIKPQIPEGYEYRAVKYVPEED